MAIDRNRIVVLLLVLAWGASNFILFPKSLLDFGFTPDYLKVASDTEESGRYTVRLPNYLGRVDLAKLPSGIGALISGKTKTIYEVQREPLYPFVLILIRHVTHDYTDIVWLQLLCMLLSLYMWGMFVLTRFGWKAGVVFFILLFLSTTMQFYISVLYPYAFQFLFITAATLALIQALENSRRMAYLVAGIAMGAAIYERGAYLALPYVLTGLLLLVAKRIHIKRRDLLLLPISSTLLIAPWIIRNYRLGTTGMNQMLGYTLGITYGDLVNNPGDPFSMTYESFVSSLGTDEGSTNFIESQVLIGDKSYSWVDQHLASVVIKSMAGHYRLVIARIVHEMTLFPSRLVTFDLGKYQHVNLESPWDFYFVYVSRSAPSALDWIVFALSLCGLLSGLVKGRPDAVVFYGILFYTFFVSTTIIQFDPRYRGALDPILYALSGKAVADLFGYVNYSFPAHKLSAIFVMHANDAEEDGHEQSL